MEPTDEELAAASLEGRKEAFSLLVERHQDAVFNLALRMTGNRSDAADAAQEAFIRAYRRLSTYRPEYSFRNWVLGICANVTKNRFRSESRRRALETEHMLAGELDAPGTRRAASPREQVLEQALMRLPEKTRALLVLKYMEGLSGGEIARALNIGLGAVKMRLLRGREELLELVRAMERGTTS
jgi:RNA polymerase sigma-70 factor (ECF subfamily)